MTRDDLKELHYITPLVNLPSILADGILSHDRAEKVQHVSVAMEEVQELRAKVTIPQTQRNLHSHANLYINARNRMMYKRRLNREELCVVRVSTEVLSLPNVVVTDMNAAKKIVRFSSVDSGLKRLDHDYIFAKWWNHDDLLERDRHGSAMCAEVLVPNRVPPEYIEGIYVASQDGVQTAQTLCPDVKAKINGYMFFL